MTSLSCANELTKWCQIEEVKGVVQVMDEEEEIALQEFAKFEEKLKQQKGAGAVASSSLDSIPS